MSFLGWSSSGPSWLCLRSCLLWAYRFASYLGVPLWALFTAPLGCILVGPSALWWPLSGVVACILQGLGFGFGLLFESSGGGPCVVMSLRTSSGYPFFQRGLLGNPRVWRSLWGVLEAFQFHARTCVLLEWPREWVLQASIQI